MVCQTQLDCRPTIGSTQLHQGPLLHAEHGLFLAREHKDGLYSPSSLIVTGQKSNASYIGNQTGAQLQWKLNRHLTFMMDYEHFFPGEFLKQSTAGQSVDYFTAWLDFRF